MKFRMIFGLVSVFFSLISFVNAGTNEQKIIVPSAYITPIKIGVMEVSVFYGLIDSNNAHPVGVVGFFVPTLKGPAKQIAFEVNDEYVPFLNMTQGADCTTSSVRIVSSLDSLKVVYATRKGGWLDSNQVDFSVFELTESKNEVPGVPNFYFKQVKKIGSKKRYCDVNDALNFEDKLYR